MYRFWINSWADSLLDWQKGWKMPSSEDAEGSTLLITSYWGIHRKEGACALARGSIWLHRREPDLPFYLKAHFVGVMFPPCSFWQTISKKGKDSINMHLWGSYCIPWKKEWTCCTELANLPFGSLESSPLPGLTELLPGGIVNSLSCGDWI